jgi:hypothetical protein
MLDQLLMDMLQNKEKVLAQILADADQTQTIIQGLGKVVDRIEDSSEADLRKQFQTLLKITARQNQTLRRLLVVAFVYIQSNDFDGSLGQALSKMGRGKEALQAMFKNKMGGK